VHDSGAPRLRVSRAVVRGVAGAPKSRHGARIVPLPSDFAVTPRALRHTCPSLLIESELSLLRLQRWMGHHSPAFTLETHGHLIDGDLGPALELRQELRTAHG
jgi:integrase